VLAFFVFSFFLSLRLSLSLLSLSLFSLSLSLFSDQRFFLFLLFFPARAPSSLRLSLRLCAFYSPLSLSSSSSLAQFFSLFCEGGHTAELQTL